MSIFLSEMAFTNLAAIRLDVMNTFDFHVHDMMCISGGGTFLLQSRPLACVEGLAMMGVPGLAVGEANRQGWS